MGNRLNTPSEDVPPTHSHAELQRLRLQVVELKEELEEARETMARVQREAAAAKSRWERTIEDYVDDWFETHRDAVDIGVVDIMGRVKVDILPDELEKRIYKKMLRILLSLVIDDS